MEETTNKNKHPKMQNDDDNTTAGAAAEWLIETILNSGATLFHDQRNVSYIAYDGDGTHVDRLASTDFEQWLSYVYWQEAHKSMPGGTGGKVIQTLTGHARHEGIRYELSVRHAKNERGLWYDLGDSSAVHVTADGWQIDKRPPILFRRYSHQEPQVQPTTGGDLELLRPFINIAENDNGTWLLFLVNLITAFVPGFPHPILVLHGPQGAGKTTPMRVMKKLLDPSVLQGTLLPTKEADFAQLAEHHAFLFFDNLSNISPKMSDALARASTGDGFNTRELYTTDNDFIRIIQRPIAMNGINQVVTKPDLLDRSILIKLKRISKEQRQPEEAYWQAFNGIRPQLLGAIFDVLAKALALYPDIELEVAPRMADFARLGSAIAEALGSSQQKFIQAYQDNIDLQNEEAIEASPVAKAVIMLMSERDEWEGMPAELLSLLTRRYDTFNLSSSPSWPKAPEWMTRRLIEVQTNLEVIGILVEIRRTNEGRQIRLTKTANFADSTDIPFRDEDDSMSAMSVSS